MRANAHDPGIRTFSLPKQLADDSFALRGTWALDYQGATAPNDDNAITLNYTPATSTSWSAARAR